MKRVAYFDNAKVLLIILVVFGHWIQPLTHTYEGINQLYQWIYTFHMPAFILIAGFFAKGVRSKKDVWVYTTRLLIPYFCFQLLYTGYYWLIGKANWQMDHLFAPQWSLWFLVSLFSWQLLLTLFKHFPPLLGSSLAILLGLLVGYFPEIGGEYSLSRTFVFFPFFLVGYWLTKEQVLRMGEKKWLATGIVLLVTFLILSPIELSDGWLFGSKSYEVLGEPVYGIWIRIAMYGIAFAMTYSFLTIVPHKHYKWTKIGEQTLYIYLLHGFLIQASRQLEIWDFPIWVDTVLAIIIPLAIVYLLSRPIINRTCKRLNF